MEIGSGCGYQAAILSQLANQVFSIERNLNLLNSARIRLKKMGFRNVLLRHGDGYQGYEASSPYDAIVVTAAAEFVPNALINQLKSGGILVMPIGGDNQQLVKIMKTETGIEKKSFESKICSDAIGFGLIMIISRPVLIIFFFAGVVFLSGCSTSGGGAPIVDYC